MHNNGSISYSKEQGVLRKGRDSMVDKLQIIFTKSFYYEGAYQIRQIAPEQLDILCGDIRVHLEAVNLTVQLMVERELYITFDELIALHVAHHEAGSRALLSGS